MTTTAPDRADRAITAPERTGRSPELTPKPSRLAVLGRRLAATWRAMDQPVIGRRIPGTTPVALTGMLVNLGVALYVVPTGAPLWEGDAASRLVIAGRIFNARGPALQQLGTVWLPAPPLFKVPFTLNFWLWYTGWSAAILAILCMGLTSAALYRIAARLGLGRSARLITVLVIWTNVAFMYLSTTAMTEPFLAATMIGSVAGLVHWATGTRRPVSGGELAVFAGIPAALAVLSRYEGWVLVASGVIFIAIVEWRRSHKTVKNIWRFILFRRVVPYVGLPAAAIAWWLSYNYTQYGNALEFVNGQYAAGTQQSQLDDLGLLTTKRHLGLSLFVYNVSVWEAIGTIVVVLSIVGFAWLIYRQGLSTATLTVGVLFGTYVFSLAALYLGQTIIFTFRSLPHDVFNVRYGLQALLFCAVSTGFAVEAIRGWIARILAVHRLRAVRARVASRLLAVPAIVVAFGFVGQAVWWAAHPIERVPVITESYLSYQHRPHALIAYLRTHYDGGDILIDDLDGGSALMPSFHIRLSQFYARPAGEYFTQALHNPARYVRWIVVRTQNRQNLIWLQMRKDPAAFAGYQQVFQEDVWRIYRRAG